MCVFCFVLFVLWLVVLFCSAAEVSQSVSQLVSCMPTALPLSLLCWPLLLRRPLDWSRCCCCADLSLMTAVGFCAGWMLWRGAHGVGRRGLAGATVSLARRIFAELSQDESPPPHLDNSDLDGG